MKMKKFLVAPIVIGAAVLGLYQFSDSTQLNLDTFTSVKQCLAGGEEMVFIPGGSFTMGAGAVYPEETPSIRQTVDSFYMSRHEVTNQQFAEFVKATGYVTVAERTPDAALYPHIPAEQLKAGSAVFVKLSQTAGAKNVTNWWHFTEGANWTQPTGPGSSIKGMEHYPVIHIMSV